MEFCIVGGVIETWPHLLQMLWSELLQLLTCRLPQGLHLHLMSLLSRPIYDVTWCAERGWWLETAWENTQLQSPRAGEKQVSGSYVVFFFYWVFLYLPGNWKHSGYSDWMPFVRGLQRVGGRLVPGCVDKRSIRRGTKKKKKTVSMLGNRLFFPPLSLLINKG